VLDPAPLITALTEGDSARASFEASQREYLRLKSLYEQNQNVSTRAVEAAEAAMRRDKIQVQAAQTKVMLFLGKAAEGTNLADLVNGLVELKTALARIDLPLGQGLRTPPQGGRLAAVAMPDKPLDAKFLGAAPAADAQTQAEGFLFLLTAQPPPPGTALSGWLKVPGEPDRECSSARGPASA